MLKLLRSFWRRFIVRPAPEPEPDPRNDLAMIMPTLREVQTELVLCQHAEDQLRAIVVFFSAVSELRDLGLGRLIWRFKDVDGGRSSYSVVVGLLFRLQTHLDLALDARGKRPRAPITENTVYLGGENGLWQKPVSFWAQHREEPVAHTTLGDPITVADQVGTQATAIMFGHLDEMIEMIDEIGELVE